MTVSDKAAQAISQIFHPFIVVLPTMVIAMLEAGAAVELALFWTALSVCVVVLPLWLLVYSGVRSGRFSDSSVSIREQRRDLYVLAGILMAVLLAVQILGKAPRILVACLAAAVLATILGFLINTWFTKLSLHSIGMAGCATVLILMAPAIGAVAAIFAVVVGWARMHLKHHTASQILIGWFDAGLCVVLMFHVFHLLSWPT